MRVSGSFAPRSALFAAIVCLFISRPILAKSPPSNICSLLTPAQLKKTVGQPFGTPQKSTAPPAFAGQPSGTQCEYAAQKGPAVKAAFIAYVDSSAAQAKQTFDRLSAFYRPKSKPAIGDGAYMDANGAIHVLKGRVRFFIAIEPGGTSKINPFLSWMNHGQSSSDTPAKEKQVKDLAALVAGEP
jgi:hypothetical protein